MSDDEIFVDDEDFDEDFIEAEEEEPALLPKDFKKKKAKLVTGCSGLSYQVRCIGFSSNNVVHCVIDMNCTMVVDSSSLLLLSFFLTLLFIFLVTFLIGFHCR